MQPKVTEKQDKGWDPYVCKSGTGDEAIIRWNTQRVPWRRKQLLLDDVVCATLLMRLRFGSLTNWLNVDDRRMPEIRPPPPAMIRPLPRKNTYPRDWFMTVPNYCR